MEIKPQMVTATVIEKIPLNAKVIQITLSIKNPSAFQFVPGQYGTVIIDPTTRRQYSFASAPNELPNVTFVIDTSPGGPGSKYFEGITVASTIAMLAPLGNFCMEDTPRKKVCIATGTGIAPFRSMLRNELSIPMNTLNYALYWGLRHEEDIYWNDEFIEMTKIHQNFSFVLSLSQPTSDWPGARGHVTENIIHFEEDPIHADYYLCGNSTMITEVTEKLKAANVPENQIKTDMYF